MTKENLLVLRLLFPFVKFHSDGGGEGGPSTAAVLAERELKFDGVVDEPLHGGLHLPTQVRMKLERIKALSRHNRICLQRKIQL